MAEYRAYILGADGHIEKRIDLDCGNEQAAKTAARQLVDGHDVELWLGTRKIDIFKHKAQ